MHMLEQINEPAHLWVVAAREVEGVRSPAPIAECRGVPARPLTLTAPYKLAVTLHGQLGRWCANVWL